MDHHTGIGIAFSVAVASHVRAALKYLNSVTLLRKITRDYCTGEACAGHSN